MPDGTRALDISVVIPCRNGAHTIAAQLQALQAQISEASWEVVVANNGSTDATAAVVEAFASDDGRVRLVDASEKPGINHARNRGVQESHGANVLICDADDVVQPGWLAAYAAAFSSGAMCVGGGLDRVFPDGRISARERHLYTIYWDRPWPAGANCGFARSVFDLVGGFDESFLGGGDETDFFWKAHEHGYPTTFVHEAVVTYAVRDDNRGAWRQFFNYGRGHVRLFVKHAPSGMPRTSTAASVRRIVRAVAQIMSGARSSSRRRRGIETLAVHAGRAWQSAQSRTYYP